MLNDEAGRKKLIKLGKKTADNFINKNYEFYSDTYTGNIYNLIYNNNKIINDQIINNDLIINDQIINDLIINNNLIINDQIINNDEIIINDQIINNDNINYN